MFYPAPAKTLPVAVSPSLLHAVELVQPAATLAASLLDVTTTMGRLSAAGISFNTQPSPAAVAAAMDLAAQVTAALSPYQHKVSSLRHKQALEGVKQQGGKPPQQLQVPPLYLNPLQQQQYIQTQQLHQQQQRHHHHQHGAVCPCANYVPMPATVTIKDYPQMWSLGVPVMCFYGTLLLQQWEQLLQQQQECAPSPAAAAAAAAAAEEHRGDCGVGSSSSSRPAWEEAEGFLLLGAAALEGPAAPPGGVEATHQQQQLQQLALCRQYQQRFQQASAKLGLSSDLMAAAAAWFSEAERYSSSSSRGPAAGSAAVAAAADCLSTVCAAALMMGQIQMLVDPAYREEVKPRSTQLTAAEELAVAEFFMQVWCTYCYICVPLLEIYIFTSGVCQ